MQSPGTLRARRAALCAWLVVTASLVSGTADSWAVSKKGPAKVPSPETARNPFRTGRPLIIPHAGGDGLYPENTMVAWDASMAAGGDVVDIDVSMSSDGVLVAIHDPTVDRTTNGTGKVSTKTYGELAELDAAFRFKRNGKFPYRGRNVRIPTVGDVLKRFPDSLVTLDLKDHTRKSVAVVCGLVSKLKRADSVYVGVDIDEQVTEFRKRCPGVRTSGTSTERRAMRAAREAGDERFVTRQLVSQPPYIGDDGQKRVTAESLAFSHKHNVAVLTWVVDDPKDLADLIALGVDGIYTRRPDLMLKILEAKGLR